MLQLVAGTSERGISVGLDVLDGHGASLHRQAIHLNRTSSVAFTVPALANLTTNATLQVRHALSTLFERSVLVQFSLYTDDD